MSCNACMNLFGLMQEELLVLRRAIAEAKGAAPSPVNWTPFICGCFAGAVPWALILAAIVGIAPDQRSRVPSFVWALLIIYLAVFNCFALNMVAAIRARGWWTNTGAALDGYVFGEKMYQILSLTAKSLLLWLVVGGVNQPNSYVGD